MNRKERRQQQRMAKKARGKAATAQSGVSPLNDPALFQRAIGFHQAGQLAEAAQLYEQILSQQPNHGETLNLCGAALFAMGNLQGAMGLLKRAVIILPDYADAWFNLGNACHAAGALEDSAKAYGKAAALAPENGAAHFNLGVVLQSLGRLKEASGAYRKSLTINPQDAEALNNLGNVLADLEEFEEAEKAFRGAVSLNPGFAEGLVNLGNLLQRAGKPDGAAEVYRQALQINAANPFVWNNLGDALILTGEIRGAKEAYEKAIDLNPEYPEALSSLAYVLQELGEGEKAKEVCRKIMEVAPDRPEGFGNLANLLQEDGEMAEAEAYYRKALEVNPGYAESYRQLSSLKKFTAHDKDLEAMEKALAKGNLPDDKCAQLCFALSKAYDDLGDYDRAFEVLEKGNTLQRQGYDFDISQLEGVADEIITTFDKPFLEKHAGSGNGSEQPVFIVGMPRSGSTLIEQILASHSGVYGAEETDALPRVIDSFSKEVAYPRSVTSLDGGTFAELGKRYLDFIGDAAKDATRITDKTLSNFLHVGLIRLMFPKAKIIHSRRDPMDTCLSCYRLYFTSYQPFTYDLGELGRYYRLYRRMMDHWASVLPGAVLDMSYESLLENQEGESRRLLEFCGLPWEDACLSFHESKRTVRTLSVAQVRQPIYKSSLGRWRKYEKYLGPLLKEIDKGASVS